ncbi:DUF3859 domain-containing protein [Yoonia sp. R2331]|uniref:DUF3859 domain-containing protein n=1 Tax=Yoonia sp. R2331 TaxID=3237238 RepID=UPI0034E3F127
MRPTLFLMVLPVAAWAQPAPDTVSPVLASVQSGVVCPPPTVGSAPAPDTVAGTTHLIEEEPPFVSLSNRVPAVLGIGFGVKALSEAAMGIDTVTMTVTHPPMGDGGAVRQSFETRISGIDPSLTFYQFDYDYELVQGIWQMEARKGGTILYRTTFEVVPPQMVPELAAICGFENLLS